MASVRQWDFDIPIASSDSGSFNVDSTSRTIENILDFNTGLGRRLPRTLTPIPQPLSHMDMQVSGLQCKTGGYIVRPFFSLGCGFQEMMAAIQSSATENEQRQFLELPLLNQMDISCQENINTA